MKLPEYISLLEKKEIFDVINIDTPRQFEEMYKKYSCINNSNLIFRGVNNASFKMYNSAQREWLINDCKSVFDVSYLSFIKELTNNLYAIQDNILAKYFTAYNEDVKVADLLSFAQHFNGKTPLIDFTKNFDVALFFAFDNLQNEVKNEISKYVSIYILDINPFENYNPYMKTLVTPNINESEGIFNSYQTEENHHNTNYLRFIRDLNELKRHKLIYISGYQKCGYQTRFPLDSFNNNYWNHQNLRVIIQEGVFLLNLNELRPIEEVYMLHKPDSAPKIICLNINRSLHNRVIREIEYEKSFPINHDNIYPDEDKIVEKVYYKTVSKYVKVDLNMLENFREYKRLNLNLYEKAESMLNKSIEFEIYRFKISDLDKINLNDFGQLKNVLYYFKFTSFNVKTIIKTIDKIRKAKAETTIKFPRINSDIEKIGAIQNLYVGKSEKLFSKRLKQHFSGAEAKIWSLHLGAWKEIIKEDIELELYYYSFGDLKPEEKPLLELIESSLHYKLKPLLGRKGH